MRQQNMIVFICGLQTWNKLSVERWKCFLFFIPSHFPFSLDDIKCIVFWWFPIPSFELNNSNRWISLQLPPNSFETLCWTCLMEREKRLRYLSVKLCTKHFFSSFVCYIATCSLDSKLSLRAMRMADFNKLLNENMAKQVASAMRWQSISHLKR